MRKSDIIALISETIDERLVHNHISHIKKIGGGKFVWRTLGKVNTTDFYPLSRFCPVSRSAQYSGLRKYTYSEVMDILSEALCIIHL